MLVLTPAQRKVLRGVLVVLLSYAVLSLFIVVSVEYFSSYEDAYKQSAQNKQHSYVDILALFGRIYMAPFSALLKHDALITALATIAIAWFTYALTEATVELRQMAKTQDAT